LRLSRPSFPRRGLYAITPDQPLPPAALAAQVAAAIAGGAMVIQHRCKDAARRGEEAGALLAVCRSFGIPFIVNDDIELAHAIGADGVHLGRDDGAIDQARSKLGPDAIIGLSCYDDLNRALEAQAEGATYVAFGRFFPSRTKPHAPCASLDTLRAAQGRIQAPIVAIGGITTANGGALLSAGADLLAVIDGVFGEDDVKAAAARLSDLF